MSDDSFKGWKVLQEMPEGWKLDKTVGSPLYGHVFITNGKSALNGQKRALLKIAMPTINSVFSSAVASSAGCNSIDMGAQCTKPLSYDEQVSSAGFRRSVNELARETFKLNLLRDIMCDLTICEIEGWCKTEYINQIKNMVAEIGLGKTIESSAISK